MGSDRRARRHDARFGANPECLLCGERRPEALLHVPRSTIIELHHVSGAANDPDLLVPLCFNCHRKITARYAEAGVSMEAPDTLIHRLLAMLAAWEVFFADFAASCGTWAGRLRRLIEWFDNNLNGWRTWAIWRDLNGPSRP
jgi:hypothetical protein